MQRAINQIRILITLPEPVFLATFTKHVGAC